MRGPDLAGKHILVVEDELLIAMMLESALRKAGCIVVGPFGRLSAALDAARGCSIDAAILDVNLAGERVFPVAEELAGRAIPFLLLSGYGKKALPPDHPNWLVCSKPFKTESVLAMLDTMINASRPQSPPQS